MDTNSDNLSDSGRLFKEAQENDPTLKHWRNLAELGSKTYVLHHGILWKRPDPQVLPDNTLLLCVPQNYRLGSITRQLTQWLSYGV